MAVNFVYSHNEQHDLTDYHKTNHIYGKTLQQEIFALSDSIKTLTSLEQYCKTYGFAKKDEDELNSTQSQPNLNFSEMDDENLTEDKIIAAVSNYRDNKKYYENERNKCRICGFENNDRVKCPAQGKEYKKGGKRIILKEYVVQKHSTNDIIIYIKRNRSNCKFKRHKFARTSIKCIPNTVTQITVAGQKQMK